VPAWLDASNVAPEYFLTGVHPNSRQILSRFRFYSGQPVASVILKQQHFLKVSIKFYSLTISLHDIQLPLTLLEQVNKSLHLNCQFDILNIDLVQVTLLPRIRVLVSGFQMRAYSKPPNDWNQEEIENALASNRLEIIDSLTSAINSKLKSNSVDLPMALLHVPMHCVDILIATAILEMRSISVCFSAHRSGQPDDILLEVKIDQLLVNPSGSYSSLLCGPMFQVCLSLFAISSPCPDECCHQRNLSRFSLVWR
jgi:hypothetical protein